MAKAKRSRNTYAGKKGGLFIVSAPSGAGKTTLCHRLCEILPHLRHSVSYTTRQKRPGEINNRDYTFVSEPKFREMIRKGEFIEWAKVHGNMYGTSGKRLAEMRSKGINVILDIDVQGARQIRKKCDDGIYIFILPPSMKVLRERLKKRMSNSRDDMERRLGKAREEIEDYKKYDYVIINHIFNDALDQLKCIVLLDRCRTRNINSGWVEKIFLGRRIA